MREVVDGEMPINRKPYGWEKDLLSMGSEVWDRREGMVTFRVWTDKNERKWKIEQTVVERGIEEKS